MKIDSLLKTDEEKEGKKPRSVSLLIFLKILIIFRSFIFLKLRLNL